MVLAIADSAASFACRAALLSAASLVGWAVVCVPLCADATSGEHAATWTGFHNMLAPTSGPIAIVVDDGAAVTCRLAATAHSASGNGWAFRGTTTALSTDCTGTVDDAGNVTAQLRVRIEWHGQVKGWDSDWDDADGEAVCEGVLSGAVATGGAFEAQCKNQRGTWANGLLWTPTP